jgi:hypothetical protein
LIHSACDVQEEQRLREDIIEVCRRARIQLRQAVGVRNRRFRKVNEIALQFRSILGFALRLVPRTAPASTRKIPVRDQEFGRRAAMVERRAAQRFRIPVAAEVRYGSKPAEPELMHAKTLDVSSGGLYLKSTQRLPVGTRIALLLTLPSNGIGAVVDCKAKVVRVDENSEAMAGRFGIAIVIESYNFVRPKSTP